jgi:signal peptidase I
MIKKIIDNKFLRFIYGFIKTIIWIVLLAIVVVVFIQRFFDNTNVSINGLRIFNVATGSMYPEYKIGDIIITKEVDEDEINVGDNVTYLGEKLDLAGLIITHKVVNKEEKDGEVIFTTKGVASEIEDPKITYSQIYGKVIYKTVVLSYLSKLLTNKVAYYTIFMVLGIITSIEISSSIFAKKKYDGDEKSDEEGREE